VTPPYCQTRLRKRQRQLARLESHLQEALLKNILQLEEGLTVGHHSKEYPVPSGRIDIVATDMPQGRKVAIELKASTADRDAIGQVLKSRCPSRLAITSSSVPRWRSHLPRAASDRVRTNNRMFKATWRALKSPVPRSAAGPSNQPPPRHACRPSKARGPRKKAPGSSASQARKTKPKKKKIGCESQANGQAVRPARTRRVPFWC
jgi:hypothetical protein